MEAYVVSEETTIIQTMQVINEGAKANAFICKDGKLLASVSDGDIRRYIIRGGDLNEEIKKIANYNPVFLTEDDDSDPFLLMRDRGITALPVVDREKKLIDIIFLDNKKEVVYPSLQVPVVIMAGGKGTRLRPFTEVLPKPLIPIGDRTITEHIMDRFERYGCGHFDLIINHKKNFIRSYFGEHEKKRDIDFVEEHDFLGTAGGLRLILGKYSDTFFVTNCDILVNADYERILAYHKEQNNILTMVCARKKTVIPYGTVELGQDGTVTALQEKPEFQFLTNTGLYVVEPRFIERIPPDTFIHITDVIQGCIDEGERVGVYPVEERQWMDMGQFDELEKMKKRLEKEESFE